MVHCVIYSQANKYLVFGKVIVIFSVEKSSLKFKLKSTKCNQIN